LDIVNLTVPFRYTNGDRWTATLAYFLGTGELDSNRMSFLTTRGMLNFYYREAA